MLVISGDVEPWSNPASPPTQCGCARSGCRVKRIRPDTVSLCWPRQNIGRRWASRYLGRSSRGPAVTVHCGVVGYGIAEPVGAGRVQASTCPSILLWPDAMIGASAAASGGIRGTGRRVTVVTGVAACHTRIRVAVRHARHRRISARGVGGGYPPPIGKLKALARGPHPAGGLWVCPKIPPRQLHTERAIAQ